MSFGVYPRELKNQARILGSLNRSDLILVGVLYLGLSKLNISGIKGLIIIGVSLSSYKLLSRLINPGFFRFLNMSRVYEWKNMGERP